MGWKEYVEDMKRKGMDSLRAMSVPPPLPPPEDPRPRKVLQITHHTLKRFVELFPSQKERLPVMMSLELDLVQARAVRRLIRVFFAQFAQAKRIQLPFHTVKGKFMKYGVVDSLYHLSPNGVLFTTVKEKGMDTVVTCGKPPKIRRQQCSPDPLMPNATGATYLEDVTEIHVPYRQKKEVAQLGVPNGMNLYSYAKYKHPLHFVPYSGPEVVP